jgi:hypothetical protein
LFGSNSGGRNQLPELRQSGEAAHHVAVFANIDGITKACEELEIPITGGNVSFYNETLGEGIYPTPVLGVVGILEDVHKAAKMHFAAPDARSCCCARAKLPISPMWRVSLGRRSMPRNSGRVVGISSGT